MVKAMLDGMRVPYPRTLTRTTLFARVWMQRMTVLEGERVGVVMPALAVVVVVVVAVGSVGWIGYAGGSEKSVDYSRLRRQTRSARVKERWPWMSWTC